MMADHLLSRPLKGIYHASWLYPLKGIVYFIRHPFLYKLVQGRLLPVFILSVFVYGFLFAFAFLPQVAVLAIFHGVGAWPNALFLTLGEGAAIVGLLFEAFLCDETQVDVFDAVLVANACDDLVSASRPVNAEEADPVRALGKPVHSAVYAPFSLRQILEFIIFLPLNFVPFAGVPMFLILTGYRAGPFNHWRLFKLRGYDKKQRKEFVKARKLQYTWFGTVALVLQLVPGVQMFFLLTNAAGSALWAARLEEQRRLQLHGTLPQYEDDPV